MDFKEETPYNSFSQLKSSLTDGSAKLAFQRAPAYDIVCSIHPIYKVSNFMVPIISMIGIFLICNVFGVSKWFLLLGIVVLLLNTQVPHLRLIFALIGCLGVALPFFFFEDAPWLMTIGVAFLGMNIGYDIWWGIISAAATKAFMSDEGLFCRAWLDRIVAIKTNGKTYFHEFHFQ